MLLDVNDNWEVWTEWYEARLRGEGGIEELEVARLLLPEGVWQRGPAAVNAQIRKLIAAHPSTAESDAEPTNANEESDALLIVQGPAAYSFVEEEGRIAAQPQVGVPDDPQTAEALHVEVLEKAWQLLERLSRSNAPNRVETSVRRLIDALGSDPEDINPGILLSRFRTLEADMHAYDTVEGRAELFPDAISEISDTARSTEDLMGLFPTIRRIQANALALEMQRANAEAVRAQLDEIKAAAAQSEMVAESTVEALSASDRELDHLKELADAAPDDAARADAIEKRGEVLAAQTLVHRNFLGRTWDLVSRNSIELGTAAKRGVVTGVEDGVKTAVSSTVIAGAAGLALQVAGPTAALAVLVASFTPFAKKFSAARERAERTPEEGNDGTPAGPDPETDQLDT